MAGDAICSPEVHRATGFCKALHRIRSRSIGNRSEVGNQICRLLAEYGIILPLHLAQLRVQLPAVFAAEHALPTSLSRCSPQFMYSLSTVLSKLALGVSG